MPLIKKINKKYRARGRFEENILLVAAIAAATRPERIRIPQVLFRLSNFNDAECNAHFNYEKML
jgi:hypothetical protein